MIKLLFLIHTIYKHVADDLLLMSVYSFSLFHPKCSRQYFVNLIKLMFFSFFLLFSISFYCFALWRLQPKRNEWIRVQFMRQTV